MERAYSPYNDINVSIAGIRNVPDFDLILTANKKRVLRSLNVAITSLLSRFR